MRKRLESSDEQSRTAEARDGDSLHGPGSHDPQAREPGRLEETGDARLVERSRQGDDDAFAALVKRYESKLQRVLYRMLNDREMARDIAQETFWKVYTRLDRFDTSRRFGPWLFQVGVNLCLDELRRRSAVSAMPATLSLDQPTSWSERGIDVPDPDPHESQELAQEVRYLLDKLPLPYRTVIVLRDLEGFSVAEIASIVKKREATVRWRLGRAREQFKEHWERRHADPARRGESKEANHGG